MLEFGVILALLCARDASLLFSGNSAFEKRQGKSVLHSAPALNWLLTTVANDPECYTRHFKMVMYAKTWRIG